MSSKNILSLLVILLVLGVGIYLALNPKSDGDLDGVACTMDAKMCPDGSYVGRVAPDCEFAACPKIDPSQSGEYIYKSASEEQILVSLPFPGAVTGKNFSVTGKARGMWYFEASFPIDVLDKDGKILTQGYASAEGEWMVPDFVPFKGDIQIPENYIGPATIVLKRNNASGLPEHDASVQFNITVEY